MAFDPYAEHEQSGSVDCQGPLPTRGEATRAPVRTLTPETAARIAAGEVIERPASVVKELVENAIDAGSTQVRVDVRGGGLNLIRVSDDGIGIPPSEIWLACQRHATSKLANDDIWSVRTLGFRGEALPSIATVAELSIVSAVEASQIGHRLTVRDGRTVQDEPAPRPPGTTVTVRRLFERIPARLESAARAQTELGHITHTVRRLALAAPRLRLALYIEERVVLQTSGSGDLSTVMVELFGPGVSDSLITLGPIVSDGMRLSGVMSGSELTRPGRSQVNLIVNGRWVQTRALLGAVEGAYRPLLPRGRHPIMTLLVEVPYDRVDVNVHPAKVDVRVRHERAVGQALGEMVRIALGSRPVKLREPLAFGRAALDPLHGVREEPIGWDADRLIVTPSLPPLKLVGQVRNRLILLEGSDGLYLVDQHRAHERILYERLMKQRTREVSEIRPLPEPILVELRPAQVAMFERRRTDLAALGFECEEFGGHTFLLRSSPVLPGVLHGLNGERLDGEYAVGEANELVDSIVSLTYDAEETGEDWQERLMVSLACRTALRRGKLLDRATMTALVEALGHTAAPAVCPHGSPLLMHMSGSLIERQFGWG